MRQEFLRVALYTIATVSTCDIGVSIVEPPRTLTVRRHQPQKPEQHVDLGLVRVSNSSHDHHMLAMTKGAR